MMAAVKNKDSLAELTLRSEIHAMGLRFRVNVRDDEGHPDILFRPARVAVFVDGDFWHARALREGRTHEFRERIRGKRQDFWVDKLTRNLERDDAVNRALTSAGWAVIRAWESEVLADPISVAARVKGVVIKRRNSKA